MYSGKSSYIDAKVDVLGQKCCIRPKVVVFRKNGCIRAKMLVIRQKLLYSGKSGSILAIVFVFWHS